MYGVSVANDTTSIEGWEVTRTDDGRWFAVRTRDLTELEQVYGCRQWVTANRHGELVVMIAAEKIRSSFIEAAAIISNGMAQPGRELRPIEPGGGPDTRNSNSWPPDRPAAH